VIKSRPSRWAEHVARRKEKRNAYVVLGEGESEEKTLGKPKRRWEVNIKVDNLRDMIEGFGMT
jgi:hypothetical protein